MGKSLDGPGQHLDGSGQYLDGPGQWSWSIWTGPAAIIMDQALAKYSIVCYTRHDICFSIVTHLEPGSKIGIFTCVFMWELYL